MINNFNEVHKVHMIQLIKSQLKTKVYFKDKVFYYLYS
jgi:hypothetical protein